MDSLVGLARAHNMLGDYVAANSYADEALILSRSAKSRFAEATILLSLGVTAKNRGSYGEARAHLEEAVRISREIGVETLEAVVLHNLGNAIKDAGGIGSSRVFYERSLTIHRRTGDRYFQGTNLFELASIARSEDDGGPDCPSRRMLEQSLLLCRDTGNAAMEASCLHMLGNWALVNNDVDRALPLHRRALAIRRSLGTKREIAFSLNAFAWICALRSMPADAAIFWGSEAALRELVCAPAPDDEVAYFARLHDAMRDSLPPGEFEAAWQQGRDMDINAAVEYALVVTADLLEAGLTP